MDDGDIMCHPVLVHSYFHEFDDANAKVGEERNLHKKEVIYCVDDLGAPPEWKVDDVRKLVTVSTVTAGSTTLGVAVGPRQFIAERLLAKAHVIRAMHERAHLCQDPQTWFALQRGSLGVGRINHRRHELQKSTTRLDKGLERSSSQNLQRTARCHTQRRPLWNRLQKSA